MNVGCPVAVNDLTACLQNTLSPDQSERKKVEANLKSVEAQPSYSLCPLGIVLNESLQMPTRLAAAITFKKFVKSYWKAVSALIRFRLSKSLLSTSLQR